MSNRTEYLVRYSVAPPPSRDYYGLKVLQDEIILYLWRVSHGPHKAPIIHRTKFAEFDQEKSLQDEIRRGFGKHLLRHVRNIAEGNRNALLTLPIPLIGRISRYLKFTDIIKLSSLSHVAYEVFNTDLIWEILYKRDKKARVDLEEREKANIYGWKQLYKDKEMQTSIKNQRNLRIPSSIKITNDTKNNKASLRSTCGAVKPIAKTKSIMMANKRSESSNTDLITIPLSKTMSDTRFRMHTKSEKSLSQKRNTKNISSVFNINEKNVEKNDLVTSKTIKKRETKSVSKCGEVLDKQQNKSEKHSTKINNINAKSILTQESKSKSIASKSSISKNVGNTKSFLDLTQNSHSKTRSETKIKPKKKVATNKSEIFNTDKALSENSFVDKDDNFELSDLIEASLKNIRSPRSIFDYDFSYMQQSNATKDAWKIRNEIQSIDKLKHLKPNQSSLINNFSNKMIRDDGILEKLSEKSEPFSETSNESVLNDKISLPIRWDNKPFSLSAKYTKTRAELLKSLDLRQNNLIFSEDRWDPCSGISLQNKSFNPRNINNNNEKSPIPRRSLKTSFLLKAYAPNSLESRKDVPAKNYKNYPEK